MHEWCEVRDPGDKYKKTSVCVRSKTVPIVQKKLIDWMQDSGKDQTRMDYICQYIVRNREKPFIVVLPTPALVKHFGNYFVSTAPDRYFQIFLIMSDFVFRKCVLFTPDQLIVEYDVINFFYNPSTVAFYLKK